MTAKRYSAFFVLAFTFLFTLLFAEKYKAAQLDEILDYEVDAYVNDDATVTLTYSGLWEVLDSDSEGPLTWVKVGVPNIHCRNFTPLTGNIDSVSYYSDGGSFARVDLDDEYYEGETVFFSFSLVQDYIYQVNKLEDGYTVYEFTPGWFDDVPVDHMTLRWSADKAYSWDPSCLVKDGALTYEKYDMAPGETFTIQVTYPNEAYAFDMSKTIEKGAEDEEEDFFIGLVATIILVMIPIFAIRGLVSLIHKAAYKAGAGFGNGQKTKITRTKIVYFESCPGCGAVRQEGQTECSFCKHSLIKSEEIIEEKEAERFKAGGGRAGCSTKYFYKTNFRTKYLNSMK